ncbi:MAG: hypothetical protein IIC31_02995 [Chloroflexi bacterium]|nr:hypothetical protein [Chloroflexota bacterium]
MNHPNPIIAAGGVADVENLVRLAELGVEGAIIGLALYDGRVQLLGKQHGAIQQPVATKTPAK